MTFCFLQRRIGVYSYKRIFCAAIAALATYSIILLIRTRRAGETVANTEQERRLADQLCGSTQQNSTQWYRQCLKLKYSLDENWNDGSGGNRTEKQSFLVNGRRSSGDNDIKESRDGEERVVGWIEACFLATNLSRYLEREGFLSAARDNARHMFRALRTLIPRTFSNNYLSPCWEADFKGSVRLEDKTIKWVLDSIETVTSFSTLGFQKFQERQMLRSFSHHHGSVSSRLVCLPKFFVAGFPKCGTTYLYCLMGQRFGGGSNVAVPMKEPKFWASGMHSKSSSNSRKAAVGHISPYLFNFINASMKLSSSHYQSMYQQPLTIDGSTNMMAGWPRFLNEPSATNYCLIPAVMTEVLPDSKYVVIMRNPVDRLYSAFWYSCHMYKGNVTTILHQNGPDIFHERIMTRLEQFTKCIRTFPTAVCLKFKETSNSSDLLTCGRTQLEVSLYYIHIQKWLSVISRDSFVFLTMEELSTDINLVEKKLLALLGLDYPSKLNLEEGHVLACSGRTNSQSDYSDNPQLRMRKDTQEILTDFFRPYNQKLADLLGDDKFLWEN